MRACTCEHLEGVHAAGCPSEVGASIPEPHPEAQWERAENVACVECPSCAFTFDAFHTDEPHGDSYSCPSCAELNLRAELDVLVGRLEQAEKERQEWEDRAGDALATLNTVELERDDLSEAARINRLTAEQGRRSGEGPH
jgi:hypothetical protein